MKTSPFPHPAYHYYLATSYYELVKRTRGFAHGVGQWSEQDQKVLAQLQAQIQTQVQAQPVVAVVEEAQAPEGVVQKENVEQIVEYIEKARESYSVVLNEQKVCGIWNACFNFSSSYKMNQA